ncbi:hypothetical protein N9E76_00555 [bacterium]|nr:hypothetical protein [bacterium]
MASGEDKGSVEESIGLEGIKVGLVLREQNGNLNWDYGKIVSSVSTADNKGKIRVNFSAHGERIFTGAGLFLKAWNMTLHGDKWISPDRWHELQKTYPKTWIGMRVTAPAWEAPEGFDKWNGRITNTKDTEDGYHGFEVTNEDNTALKGVYDIHDFLEVFRFVKGA